MNSEATQKFILEVESIGFSMIDLIAKDRRVKGDGPSRAAAGILATIAEQYIAALSVLKSIAPSDALTILRSMVEAQADYFCLLTEPDKQWKRMEMAAAKGYVDVVEGFLESPETRDLVGKDKLGQLEMAKKILGGLKEQGVVRDKSKLVKFERAGLSGNYVAFQFLCSPTHTDLNAVTARHVRDDRIILFDDLPPVMIRSVCAVMVASLSQCVERFPEISDLTKADVERAFRSVNARWAAAVAALNEVEKLPPIE